MQRRTRAWSCCWKSFPAIRPNRRKLAAEADLAAVREPWSTRASPESAERRVTRIAEYLRDENCEEMMGLGSVGSCGCDCSCRKCGLKNKTCKDGGGLHTRTQAA